MFVEQRPYYVWVGDRTCFFLDRNDADVFGLLLQELMPSAELDHRP
jgi:hypothetical protein